ncbi:glutamate--tRNA ligase [Syntrophomonas erecta]
MSKPRVRFAPSPTGPLHIGGARSALFNYLIAAHQGGELVLRIEDTDLDRSRREYEDEIIKSLRWLGLTWSEGVDVGGDNGPYRQTERLSIYQEYVEKLLESGQAYYCFCTEAELEAQRKSLMEQGETPRYLGKCRYLSEEEKQEKLAQGIKPTIRFKVPENQVYVVHDLVRGKVAFESENIGDFIIVKSDGIPTYNFAVVIDDSLMGITHVVRAEEHLTNTPRQLMIYEALNLKRPEFAHISLILGNDRQKMSKRHGATSLIQYREMGYLPEALFNFLALMGWSPEGEEEILSPEEIIKSFSLERVAKSPAVFDLDKLNWINQQYIKRLNNEELNLRLQPFFNQSVYRQQLESLSGGQMEVLLGDLRDRLVCLGEVDQQLQVFFGDIEYQEKALEVLRQENVMLVLDKFAGELPDFTNPAEIKRFIKTIVKQTKLKPKDVFMPLRCALTGQVHGPDLPDIITVWGKQKTLSRIEHTVAMLKN